MKKFRWQLLKRSENLGDEQHFRLSDLLRYDLKTVRAYLRKEAFQQLWGYYSPAWAGKFLDQWCRQTMRSRIEPMKKTARSLRQYRELILNYFRDQKLISRGVVEGLNDKAKVTMKKSYGFPSRVPSASSAIATECLFLNPFRISVSEIRREPARRPTRYSAHRIKSVSSG